VQQHWRARTDAPQPHAWLFAGDHTRALHTHALCCMQRSHTHTHAGKLAVLHRLLTKLHVRGHRVVLFSQFTMMLDLLEDYLAQAGFE
jgi:chromodomain-helicase-DNA-binding protein 4